MAKRGILGRILGGIGRIFRGEGKPSPPTVPPPPVRPRETEPGEPSDVLRRAAYRHMMNTIPFAKDSTVKRGVQNMDIRELRWTVKATLDQLRNAAAQKPDRLLAISGGYVPLNPWWYK